MSSQAEEELDALVAAWRARDGSEMLYLELRDPMRQAARQGIRRITRESPDEDDVDNVVLRAFREVLAKDSTEVRSVVGFARTVAYRRGMDRGRQINREKKEIRDHKWVIHDLHVSSKDELAAAETERLFRHAEACMEQLTQDQRILIEHIIMQQHSLSEWAIARGTSYEAGRRMLLRGLRTLRRCVDRNLHGDEEEEL